MKTVRFGIIGCGLMGREFAGAVARWCHLTELDIRAELVAICNRTLSPERIDWFTDNFPSLQQVTSDYSELVANPEVDAVYCAVPHNMHEEIYCAIIEAGKHLLGEKPFGVDLRASESILKCIEANTNCLARAASQYIYFPGAQRILRMVEEGAFGRIIEVDSGFFHCSDLDPKKPINWKRLVDANGEYGCMGDLGFHNALVPIRAGWVPKNVRAILANIVPERPDESGRMVPCETWDNATLLVELSDPAAGVSFPWTLKVHRIMPGEKNTWYIGIYGTRCCARFSLKNPKRLELLRYENGEQAWERIDMGYETPYGTITGGVFEFGAPDAFMQLVAAFIYELSHGKVLSKAAACPTPREMHWCHRLFTAAIASHRGGKTADV